MENYIERAERALDADRDTAALALVLMDVAESLRDIQGALWHRPEDEVVPLIEAIEGGEPVSVARILRCML